MDKQVISIEKDEVKQSFEVIDYPHHDDDRCKFEVFRDADFIASFEPDRHGFLHICKNSGNTDEEVLHLIADKIEALNW